ncbi:MAG: MATE family efflux transporter [Bacteroidales bacterium]|jgi:putative MATE family efflux protein|nr:MATE family efflux transporter [Bacteroidales bacterium]
MAPTELGTEKIGKLLKQYAMPAIVAMAATSLYNMVDSIYIGQGVGAMAIAGLAVTFPLMNLSVAFGTLVGVGASTLISMLLGQKNYSMANRVLGNIVMLNMTIGLIVSILGLTFLEPILYFFGASDVTLPYAKEYISIILMGNVVTHCYHGLNNAVRASGHPKQAMYATLLTVGLNTILDPIFIFALDMGIKGAAIATVLSQVVSLIWVIIILFNKKNVLHFSKEIFHFDIKIASRSLSIGLSPFLMNAASCFVVIFINRQLQNHGGDMAIGAYGIVNRIIFLFVMLNMGFTQGMQPIAGYNYGAKQYDRVKHVLKLTIFCATITTTIGFLAGQLMPRTMVSLFTNDTELIDLAAHALRIVMIAFPVVGFQMCTSHFFQCIGHASRAIFLSMSRQLVFLIPLLIFFPMFWGANGVWWSMPTSDLVAAVIAFFMLRHLLKNFGKNEKIDILTT